MTTERLSEQICGLIVRVDVGSQHIPGGDLIPNKMAINLYMLYLMMLKRIDGEVHCGLVVTMDAKKKRKVEHKNKILKPSAF